LAIYWFEVYQMIHLNDIIKKAYQQFECFSRWEYRKNGDIFPAMVNFSEHNSALFFFALRRNSCTFSAKALKYCRFSLKNSMFFGGIPFYLEAIDAALEKSVSFWQLSSRRRHRPLRLP